MGLIVQKFGGTSLSNIDRIRKVALLIKQEIDSGNMPVVVVSAMAGVTNQLVNYTKQLNAFEGSEEYDAVVSSGEQITAGLVAQSLKEHGLQARSFTAWQLPIVTDDLFGKANIKSINTYTLKKYVQDGGVPVITGFQGVCDGAKITTFGRGGTDMTSVAVAAAIEADLCDIYTDVSGIFTADPMIVPNAKIIEKIDYIDMLEMAYCGAKVLQSRAVEYAINNCVKLRVKSSFVNGNGSLIDNFETKSIVGMTLADNLEKINIFFNSDEQFNKIIDFFNDNETKYDINIKCDSFFSVYLDKDEVHVIAQTLQHSGLAKKIEYIAKTGKEHQLSKITIIGRKTKSFAEQIEIILKTHDIFYKNVFQFKNKVIVWVGTNQSKIALNAIHDFCFLDTEE